MEHPRLGGADEPLDGVAAHVARYARIGDGASFCDESAQIVAPLGLHYAVTVHPSGEAGAQRQYDGRVGDGGAGVVLGQNGVHHRVKGKGGADLCRRIGQHRYLARSKSGLHLVHILHCPGGDALHRCGSVIAALTKGDRPPYRCGLGQVGHHHRKTAPVQPHRYAGGQIARAFD